MRVYYSCNSIILLEYYECDSLVVVVFGVLKRAKKKKDKLSN